MSKQSALKQDFAPDVLYKVGEQCLYWLKFGEYTHQQAVEDHLLDAQGNLTPAGLQAIVSEREQAKERGNLLQSLKAKGHGKRRKIKVNGSKRKTSSSSSTLPRKSLEVSSRLRTYRKNIR